MDRILFALALAIALMVGPAHAETYFVSASFSFQEIGGGSSANVNGDVSVDDATGQTSASLLVMASNDKNAGLGQYVASGTVNFTATGTSPWNFDFTDAAGETIDLNFSPPDRNADGSFGPSFFSVPVSVGGTINGTINFSFGPSTCPGGAFTCSSPVSVSAFGTISGGETPIPGTFPLLASALGAVGLFGWRRRRMAAAAISAA